MSQQKGSITIKTDGGMSFTWVLFVIFLVLKLIHAIDWSWWWVTAPIWISAILAAVIWIFIALAFILKYSNAGNGRNNLRL